MLLTYQLQDNSFSLGKSKKFIPIIGNKRMFKLHNQNLKLHSFQGLQSKKYHSMLTLKQEPFLKLYSKENIELQREAEEGNKIKKEAELRNNAIFRKLIENPMSKIDVKIVSTRKLKVTNS